MRPSNPSRQRGDPQRPGLPSRRVIHPIFLPHFGCPFRCVYCNQNCITAHSDKGLSRSDPLASFHAQLQTLVSASRDRSTIGEVALYGGTFTALPKGIQAEILNALAACVSQGTFSGIRFSTRPDGISADVCAFLRGYPIRMIELGVQSFSDHVLEASGRGYDFRTAMDAAVMVREAGWELGIQLMVGLPGDNLARFRQSVRRTVEIAPEMARLYPTLVLKDTRLAAWLLDGRFSVLSLDEAVDWCSWAYDAFVQSGVNVGRMGLHADPQLTRPGNIVAGPFHPAFGYLVRVRWWRDRIDAAIEGTVERIEGRSLVACVPERALSEVLGPGRENLAFWKEKWQLATIRAQVEKDWPLDRFECAWE
ncbi:MAG: elongator complex protein 3 [Syntrophobacteraceae bacterium]